MPEAHPQESELVPLSVAASLAYFDLAGMRGAAGSEQHLREVLELAVIALSQVAPILQLRGDGGGASLMSSAQVEQRLFAPIREGRRSPDLESFYIRRGDLHAAITSLRRHF